MQYCRKSVHLGPALDDLRTHLLTKGACMSLMTRSGTCTLVMTRSRACVAGLALSCEAFDGADTAEK